MHAMDHNIAKRTKFKHDIYEKYEFHRGKPLGRGSFGTVYKAREKSTGHEYAIKTIPKKRMSSLEISDLYREVDIMETIGVSLNCVYMYEAYEDNDYFYLVLELCKGGELYGRIKRGHYSEAQAALIVRHVLQVCAQCHAKKIVYRDLKPENFLFSDKSIDSPLKATDFGLAAYLPAEGHLRDASGTPVYMAPEVIRRKYGFECDLWSAGVVAYQMLSGRLPFPGPPHSDHTLDRDGRVLETFKQILQTKPDLESDPWPHISRSARDFVQRLLVKSPTKRMTVEEALAHPWITRSEKALAGGAHPEECAALHGTVVQRLQRFSIYGHFKQLALHSIAARLGEETLAQVGELAELKQMFLQMHEHLDKELAEAADVSKVPDLTYEEFKSGLIKCGYTVTPDEAQQLCERVDFEQSGSINYREFITALADWTQVETSKEWEHAAEEEFAELDEDHDDHLDLHEIGKLMHTASGDGEVFTALRDGDHEGTDTISRADFMDMVKPHTEDNLEMYDRRLSHQETANPTAGATNSKALPTTVKE